MHRLIWILSFLILASGCTKKEDGPPPSSLEALLKKGRTAYFSRCIACHNLDPHKPGSLGPEIHGSSLELLRFRVLEGKYPPGYKPKRETHLMAPIKDAEKDLEAIHVFLNQ